MNVEIPNWPLVTLETIKPLHFLLGYVLSLFRSEKKINEQYRGNQTLILETF